MAPLKIFPCSIRVITELVLFHSNALTRIMMCTHLESLTNRRTVLNTVAGDLRTGETLQAAVAVCGTGSADGLQVRGLAFTEKPEGVARAPQAVHSSVPAQAGPPPELTGR